ncbi:DUF4326 domain-containing protein [Planctomycetales bacterium ZRK34]|nr:DUF4326 domain-containing protein [Planctomycetales bacterium ZRK34]
MNQCTVVHVKHHDFDVYGGRQVTIRRKQGTIFLARSPFANPFVVGRHGTRDQVIAQFRPHFLSRIDLMRQARRELAGQRVACWCAPEACHLDVVAAVVNLTELQFGVLVDVVEATRSTPNHTVMLSNLYTPNQTDETYALVELGAVDLVECFDPETDTPGDMLVRIPRPEQPMRLARAQK